MKKIIKKEKGFDFIYGSEIEHLDIDWTLDKKELAEALSALIYLPNEQKDFNYRVISDENHVIILLKDNEKGYEDANFAALVNVESTCPLCNDDENFTPERHIKYNIKYIPPTGITLSSDRLADYADIDDHIADILGKKNCARSVLDDFPWQTLKAGFPVCYKGYYFFAHKFDLNT